MPSKSHIDREVRVLLMDDEWDRLQAEHSPWKFWRAWFRPGSFLHDADTRVTIMLIVGFLAFVMYALHRANDGVKALDAQYNKPPATETAPIWQGIGGN